MKKIAGLALVLMSSVVLIAQAADVTPAKISLFPQLSYPASEVVHGLDLGIIATRVDEVQGLQVALIYGDVEQKMVGLQGSFVNEAENVTGVQWGFYNGARQVTGVQFGFINVTERMKGIQVGLVNVIKKGIIPVMVIVNASF